MTRKEVLISGFGGQGVLLAGRLLGLAAVLAGLRATMLVSHGTETRGGYVRSQVVMAQESIDNPLAERPHVFCALSQAAYSRFLPLAAAGLTLYDPALVRPAAAWTCAQQALPARALALEHGGGEALANMAALGGILRRLDLFPVEYAFSAARELLPRKLEENLRVLQAGYAYCPASA